MPFWHISAWHELLSQLKVVCSDHHKPGAKMSEPLLSLVTDPYDLESHIDSDEIIMVDLSRAPVYARNHIPGALYLDYA